MTTAASTQHPEHLADGALIALVDGEPLLEQASAQSHLAGCAQCARRLAELRRRSERVSLAVADLPVPRPAAGRLLVPSMPDRGRRARTWRHPALRAAAAILVVAGVAAATPIGRVIVARVATGFTSPGRVGDAPVAAPAARPADASPVGTRIAFQTPATTLIIRLVHRPAAGEVRLVPLTGDRVTAQVTANASVEEFLLLPGELRVRNTVSSRAQYTIALPPRTHVTVVVGNEERFTGMVDAPSVVPLARRE